MTSSESSSIEETIFWETKEFILIRAISYNMHFNGWDVSLYTHYTNTVIYQGMFLCRLSNSLIAV